MGLPPFFKNLELPNVAVPHPLQGLQTMNYDPIRIWGSMSRLPRPQAMGLMIRVPPSPTPDNSIRQASAQSMILETRQVGSLPTYTTMRSWIRLGARFQLT